MKYLIPTERSDVSQFIIHVFGNNILPMKHAVRHTWLLHPSVHIATHFGQGISCSRKQLSITLKISDLFLPPGSCLQNRNSSCISFWSTNHKKAERRLTHRWIHLIEVQNNLLSEFCN